MQITVGSRVTLHFALRLSDGWVAESSFDGEPVSFVMGDGTLDKGLELALYGLKTGDRQTLTLMPGQAFGAPGYVRLSIACSMAELEESVRRINRALAA